MIQHDHSSSRVIEVRTADGTPYGSFHMAGKEPIVIKKERTDLIYSSHGCLCNFYSISGITLFYE